MKLTTLVLLLAAGGSLFAQEGRNWQDDRQYYQRGDLRRDYRDIQGDYAQVDRLRADIARDRYRLNEALEDGNEWLASRIASDLARDQRALNALLRDIARDRRDIRQDRRDLNRDRDYSRY